MSDKLLILEADRVFAHERIKEIEQKLLELAPEIEAALDQSSETWHDNAPFEILRDRRSMYLADIKNLKMALFNSTKLLPKRKQGVAGVACMIELMNTKTQKRSKYYITGDWTLRTGQLREGALIISRKAPLGALLCGKKVSDEVSFNNMTFIVTFVS